MQDVMQLCHLLMSVTSIRAQKWAEASTKFLTLQNPTTVSLEMGRMWLYRPSSFTHSDCVLFGSTLCEFSRTCHAISSFCLELSVGCAEAPMFTFTKGEHVLDREFLPSCIKITVFKQFRSTSSQSDKLALEWGILPRGNHHLSNETSALGVIKRGAACKTKVGTRKGKTCHLPSCGLHCLSDPSMLCHCWQMLISTSETTPLWNRMRSVRVEKLKP